MIKTVFTTVEHPLMLSVIFIYFETAVLIKISSDPIQWKMLSFLQNLSKF